MSEFILRNKRIRRPCVVFITCLYCTSCLINAIPRMSKQYLHCYRRFQLHCYLLLEAMAMDIKTLLNNLHEEVSCSVCMNTFTDPKTLPCLHSFCLHCLRGIQGTSGRHDMITCPECRRQSTISNGNPDALPTNFPINSLLDILAISKQCDSTKANCGNCDKKSAHSFYCFQCSAFWCENCIALHNGMRVNKEHRVLALKDF